MDKLIKQTKYNGVNCPNCDANSIETNGGSSTEYGTTHIWRFLKCTECKGYWTEQYTLERYTDFYFEDETK